MFNPQDYYDPPMGKGIDNKAKLRLELQCDIPASHKIQLKFWAFMNHFMFRSPPPRIALDGEPETIKELLLSSFNPHVFYKNH